MNYLLKAVMDSNTPTPVFYLDSEIGGNWAERRTSSLAIVLRAGAGNFTIALQVGVEDDDGVVTWVTHVELKQGRVDDTNLFTHIPGARYRFVRTSGSPTVTAFII